MLLTSATVPNPFSNKLQVDWQVETIYPFKDKLFIGSNNGMYIYDINSSPGNPVKVGEFTHARSCDPVLLMIISLM